MGAHTGNAYVAWAPRTRRPEGRRGLAPPCTSDMCTSRPGVPPSRSNDAERSGDGGVPGGVPWGGPAAVSACAVASGGAASSATVRRAASPVPYLHSVSRTSNGGDLMRETHMSNGGGLMREAHMRREPRTERAGRTTRASEPPRLALCPTEATAPHSDTHKSQRAHAYANAYAHVVAPAAAGAANRCRRVPLALRPLGLPRQQTSAGPARRLQAATSAPATAWATRGSSALRRRRRMARPVP